MTKKKICLQKLTISKFSPVLSQITNDDCYNNYDGLDTHSMVSAGYPGESGEDSCSGDSGGPLVCNKN